VLATNDTKTFVEASADTQVEVMTIDKQVEEENEEFIRREYDWFSLCMPTLNQ